MAESEERPSKMRKLDPGVGHLSNDDVLRNPETAELPPNPATEMDDLPYGLDGQDESASTIPNGETGLDKETEPVALSKSQLKKIRKKQEWEDGREKRKAIRKEKDKEKKARKAQERAEAAALLAEANKDAPPVETIISAEERKRRHQRPIQVPVSLILDCDFDDLMNEKEIQSLAAQLTRSYSDNKTAKYRAHLSVSSYGGQLKNRFETVLSNNHQGWKGVNFTENDFIAAAGEAHIKMHGADGGMVVGALAEESNQESSKPIPAHNGNDTHTEKQPATESVNGTAAASLATHSTDSNTISSELAGRPSEYPVDTSGISGTSTPTHVESSPSIIYLSSDSENTLTTLSPYTSYIIGGLVDKNRYKGICYKRARELGIPTAKLPIGEYMTMQSRTVMTTNHVVEIMIRWLEDGDWGKAFLRVIPKRKEAKLKRKAGALNEEGERDAGGEADGDGDGDGDEDVDVDVEAEVEQAGEGLLDAVERGLASQQAAQDASA
jgi:tRNA (guanine9-N1)-methyltransferase